MRKGIVEAAPAKRHAAGAAAPGRAAAGAAAPGRAAAGPCSSQHSSTCQQRLCLASWGVPAGSIQLAGSSCCESKTAEHAGELGAAQHGDSGPPVNAYAQRPSEAAAAGGGGRPAAGLPGQPAPDVSTHNQHLAALDGPMISPPPPALPASSPCPCSRYTHTALPLEGGSPA